jgi:hypothetical protein
MTPGEETLDVTTALARTRHDLVTAITADQARTRRRRRARLAGLAVAAALAVGSSAVAATAGFFAAAPEQVQAIFGALDRDGGRPGVDASRAVEIGVIDEHAAYAAPTADGGFCLYFAPNPRSGPSGTTCTSVDAGAGEIVFAPQLGTDGGFVFGRVGDASAATVEISFPGDGGRLTTPVGQDRFFLAELPRRALLSLTTFGELGVFDHRRVEAITAVASDADGDTVARSKPVELLGSLPGGGVPTETGPALESP